MTATARDKKITKLNAALEEMHMPELQTFQEPMPEADHDMAFGLAEMYANAGFRRYLQNQLNRAMKDVLRINTLEEIFFAKARVLTLRELLAKSRDQFMLLESKRKAARTLADRAETMVVEEIKL